MHATIATDTISLLLVDDEPDVSKFIKLKIAREASNINMHTVDSASDCLEFIRKNPVDCIISDYQMPGMNGMDLLRALRDGGDETPFIFITGQGNEEVAREAFINGADDYFTKEIGFAHFARIINSVEKSIKRRASEGERERAEAELEEEKNKLEAMFASMPDGLSIIGPDFTVLRQNRVQIERVGYHVGEVCYDAYHGGTEICEGCMVEEAFEDGEIHTAERTLERDGKTMYYNVTAAPVRDSLGRVIACLEITVDITDRRKAEEELFQEKNKLEAILASIGDGISIQDRDFRVLYQNQAHINIVGPHVGEHCYKAYEHRDDVCEGCPVALTYSDGGVHNVMRTTVTDKGPVYVDVISSPLKDAGGNIIAGIEVARDVTEKKRADEEIRRSQQRLQLHFNQTPLGVIEWDVDFRVSRWNPAAERIFGYKAKDAMGRHAEFILTDVAKPHVDKIWSDLLARKGGERSTNENLTSDGRTIMCEWYNTPLVAEDGSVVGVASLVQDITDRRKAEEELKASQNFLATIIETEPECVKILNPDGTLELMNRAGLDMIEAKSLDQVKGQQVIGLIAPEDKEAFMGVSRKVFAGEKAELEFGMIGFGGRRLTLKTRAVPLRDRDGNITALLGVTRDVTEQKRIEKQLEREHEQLLTILDSISEIVYVSDPQTYEVIYVNRALREKLGSDPVGGKCYEEFQGFDKPCSFCTNDIILKNKGEVYRWEHHNAKLDVYLLVEDSIIKWPDGREVRFEVAVDITDRKDK